MGEKRDVVSWENLKERNHLEDLYAARIMILKRMLTR
jgi:hypothetical protein